MVNYLTDAEDIEKVWKRLGLDELRRELVKVVIAAQKFEQTLKQLPGCDACVRVALLEHIEARGKTLGAGVINLTILAETLKDAVLKTERLHVELAQNLPHPCQCGDEKCNCHNES